MAKSQKYDGVIDAVHFQPDGSVKWVRAYLRRGPTWSDRTLIPRAELIARLKAGKTFVFGRRMLQMASTFEVTGQLRLLESNGMPVLVTGETAQAQADTLPGVPVV